jgi:hypothetical protein
MVSLAGGNKALTATGGIRSTQSVPYVLIQ